MRKNEASLKILIRNLRTRRYEKNTIQRDSLHELQPEGGKENQSGQ